MLTQGTALLVGWLLGAGPSPAAGPLVVTQGDTRAEIAEGERGLSITLTAGARQARWTYDGLSLDPEETGATDAELVRAGARRLLLVRAYSGGAHCCWSLLAFDVAQRKALGSVLESQRPIELVEGGADCALAAIAEPVDREAGLPAERTLYCFQRGRFRPRGPAPR